MEPDNPSFVWLGGDEGENGFERVTVVKSLDDLEAAKNSDILVVPWVNFITDLIESAFPGGDANVWKQFGLDAPRMHVAVDVCRPCIDETAFRKALTAGSVAGDGQTMVAACCTQAAFAFAWVAMQKKLPRGAVSQFGKGSSLQVDVKTNKGAPTVTMSRTFNMHAKNIETDATVTITMEPLSPWCPATIRVHCE